MTEIITLIVSNLIGAISSGTLVWIITAKATRKKANAEATQTEAQARGTELDNVEKAVRVWRELSTELSERVKILEEKQTELEKKICLKVDCKLRIS